MTVLVLPRLMAEAVTPAAGAVCISITNPRQSPAQLADGWHDVLRLGFHDTDRKGGGFTAMTMGHALQVLSFAAKHRDAPMTVHCEAGASRSVGVGAFLAAWRREQLRIEEDVLFPNPLVVKQLRRVGVREALRLRDRRLLWVSWAGPMALRPEFAEAHLHVPHPL